MMNGRCFIWITSTLSLLFIALSCSSRYDEVEKIAQKELSRYKELYVIMLKTGRVKLPKGGQNPHVVHPSAGGVETPMNNVWLVNGGFMGEVYECRGCDSCMTCYRDAGLIDYRIETVEQDSVIAWVQLTEKGAQYYIENFLDEPYSILNAWRRRLNMEMILVAKEKFKVEVESTDTTNVYRCTANRELELTPFLKVLGGTEKDSKKDYHMTFFLDCRHVQQPQLIEKCIFEH